MVEGVGGSGSLSGATSVTVGMNFSCAVVSGGVDCWGQNPNGELDNGTTSQSDFPLRGLAMGDISGNTSYLSGVSTQSTGSQGGVISGGTYDACALLATGAVNCWGYDSDYGELGDGAVATASNDPQYTPDTQLAVSGPHADLDALYGYSTTAMWAAGQNCTLEFSNGTTWTQATTPSGCTSNLTGITW